MVFQPSFSNTYVDRPNALRRLHCLDRANVHYDKAIKLDPDRGEYVHNQGLRYQEQGRNAEALERFREAVKLAPREIPLLFSLAKSLWRNGRFEESWNYFDADRKSVV